MHWTRPKPLLALLLIAAGTSGCAGLSARPSETAEKTITPELLRHLPVPLEPAGSCLVTENGPGADALFAANAIAICAYGRGDITPDARAAICTDPQ